MPLPPRHRTPPSTAAKGKDWAGGTGRQGGRIHGNAQARRWLPAENAVQCLWDPSNHNRGRAVTAEVTNDADATTPLITTAFELGRSPPIRPLAPRYPHNTSLHLQGAPQRLAPDEREGPHLRALSGARLCWAVRGLWEGTSWRNLLKRLPSCRPGCCSGMNLTLARCPRGAPAVEGAEPHEALRPRGRTGLGELVDRPGASTAASQREGARPQRTPFGDFGI